MNISQMEVSPSAYNLLMAFNEFMEASSKKEYRFTIEEQRELENLINILNNQINMLVDYELKKNSDKQ